VATHIQVFTTVEREEDATALARAVVEQRLAACAQIVGPINSTYWWKGKVETAREWLCVMKSRSDAYPSLEAAIKAVHPYENPEIVATPIAAGSREYLRWLDEETDKDLRSK
jgi:periplasmic divalent cation tolerance protein